jgi:DNA-binding NarL/FixJ family response regulator
MQPLTSRQAQVLELLLLGQSNKLIARALNLSVYTVKDHVGSLLRMLNVSSRTQAVLAIGRLAGKPPHLAPAGRRCPR